MNKSSNSCTSCVRFSLRFTIPFLGILAILFIASSLNAFGETSVIIPNEAADPSCVESESCYLPSKLTIAIGSTITWQNESGVIHTVTSGNPDDGPSGTFDSGILMEGDTFSHTFSEAGQYDYFCTVHPWMTGIVIVN